MGLCEQLGLGNQQTLTIDWEITPADTFGIFESWGGKVRVRNKRERYYYFYIDAWDEPAKLLLMERGVKYARVLARIAAPQGMIDACVASQGKALLDKSYAIDAALKQWLRENVLEGGDGSAVIPEESGLAAEDAATGLPGKDEKLPAVTPVILRHTAAFVSEEEVAAVVKKGNFFEAQRNPAGGFAHSLVDNNDGLTVTERVSGVMWQRGGCDLTTHRHVAAYVQEQNAKKFAGCSDWRLPTMEEALALLVPVQNAKGLYLHPCFSREQPFIFLADERKPGGYWFIDFKQATVFWASGTIPGGFGRLCRTAGG
ncbi:MAG: DUF1566 domain-containing protein [Thermodesulfobacteriota bacterium]